MKKTKKDDNPIPPEKNAVFCSFDGGGLKEKCCSNSFKLYHAINMMNDKDDILFMKCNRCGNMVAIRTTLKKETKTETTDSEKES